MNGSLGKLRTGAAIGLVLVLGACGAGPGPGSSAASVPAATPPSPVATQATPPATAAPAPSATPFALGASEARILYGWYVDEGKALYLARPDGTDSRRILADLDGDLRAHAWSPDGGRLAFVVRNATWPDGAIWTADADGSNAALLFDGLDDGCESVFHPVWSPDGKRMSMVCYHGRNADLAVLDLATMELTTLASYAWPEFLDNPAGWSPDGDTLAFDVLHWDPSDTFLTGSYIATVPSDGMGAVTQLTEYDSFAATPTWSPDGSTLIFNTYDLGNMYPSETSNLFLIDPDGENQRQVTDAPAGGRIRIAHAAWAQDGSRIWVSYVVGDDFRPAWVDPASGDVTPLDVTGSRPLPRPLP